MRKTDREAEAGDEKGAPFHECEEPPRRLSKGRKFVDPSVARNWGSRRIPLEAKNLREVLNWNQRYFLIENNGLTN